MIRIWNITYMFSNYQANKGNKAQVGNEGAINNKIKKYIPTLHQGNVKSSHPPLHQSHISTHSLLNTNYVKGLVTSVLQELNSSVNYASHIDLCILKLNIYMYSKTCNNLIFNQPSLEQAENRFTWHLPEALPIWRCRLLGSWFKLRLKNLFPPKAFF